MVVVGVAVGVEHQLLAGLQLVGVGEDECRLLVLARGSVGRQHRRAVDGLRVILHMLLLLLLLRRVRSLLLMMMLLLVVCGVVVVLLLLQVHQVLGRGRNDGHGQAVRVLLRKVRGEMAMLAMLRTRLWIIVEEGRLAHWRC